MKLFLPPLDQAINSVSLFSLLCGYQALEVHSAWPNRYPFIHPFLPPPAALRVLSHPCCHGQQPVSLSQTKICPSLSSLSLDSRISRAFLRAVSENYPVLSRTPSWNSQLSTHSVSWMNTTPFSPQITIPSAQNIFARGIFSASSFSSSMTCPMYSFAGSLFIQGIPLHHGCLSLPLYILSISQFQEGSSSCLWCPSLRCTWVAF